MKILITGGAGFIGSEFVRQGVSKGHRVIVIDKLTYAADMERLGECEGNVEFYRADVTNRDLVDHVFVREKPDVVVHWAAESHVDRSILDAAPFIEANVRGTQVLLDVAKERGVGVFVNIATDEVYGELGEDGQFTEDSPLEPNSPYSVSKASADMLGRAYQRTFGLPVITVRPSNNYGPWQYPEKLIPVVILKALRGERIPVYGKGLNVREWLYVSDCAEAVFRVIGRGKAGDVFNVGSGEERRNIDVVTAILRLLNKPEDLIEFVKDRPGHDFRYSLSVERIYGETGWRASVGFDEGISKTVSWYLDHMTWVEEKLAYLRDYWAKVYRP